MMQETEENMALLDNIGKKISQTGQEAVKQTKIMASIARHRSSIADFETKIESLYSQIGKKYFEDNRGNESSPYLDGLKMIEEYMQEIRQLEKLIQQEKGVKVCANCGAEMDMAAIFCSSCGAKNTVVEADVNASNAAEVKKCPNCGANLMEGQAFCTSCGTKIEQ